MTFTLNFQLAETRRSVAVLLFHSFLSLFYSNVHNNVYKNVYNERNISQFASSSTH